MSILSLLNNGMRARVWGTVFLIVMFKVTCMGGVWLCYAAEVDCDQLFSKEVLQQYHFDKEQIKTMQISLAALGYDPEKIDEKMGEKTISALKRFCEDFKSELAENFTDDLPATLSYYEAIAREDPDGEKEDSLNADHGETEKEKDVGTSSEVVENQTSGNQNGQFERSNEYVVSYLLTGPDLENLQTGNDIIEPLQELQDLEYANKMLFENVLDERIKKGLEEKERELFDTYKPLILAKARKQHQLDASKAINWRGWSCECVLDDLSGVVYGFYPFWLAGDEQKLDFSVLSRIGYYALSFDEDGDITTKHLHWKPEEAAFIRKARKYETKVDLVIYKNDWEAWSQFSAQKKAKVIDEATTNIVNLVDMKLTDYFSRIKPYVSFGTSTTPTMGDGVTIYFDRYPEDNNSKYLFIRFIGELKKKLRAASEDYYLNIMLQMDAIGKGVYDPDVLKELVPDIGKGEEGYEDQNNVDYFLVFIEEPTKESKKRLRGHIEDLFTGIQRRNMVRKIIPVITPHGHNEQQLADDIIYFEDNFGGVGLWPLPTSDKPAAAEFVNERLKKEYQKDDHKNETHLVANIRKLVCPNRWAFRIIWDIFTAVLLVSIVLYFTVCEWRALFMKYFLYLILGVVLPWFLFSLFLLYYDPFWEKTAEGNTPLILVVLGIISYVLWKYFKKKKEAELP